MKEPQSKPLEPARPAMFFSRLADGVAACGLCPRACRIPPGGVGACHVRRNEGGTLVADTYGRPAALQVDPIEKKPLAAFLPGTFTFSIGTFGCNLSCAFCQNHHLSRHGGALQRAQPIVEPDRIVAMAKRAGCRSVAFTYNEPTVFIEYAIDIARLARAAGLGTVLVSNGFISPEPRAALHGYSQSLCRKDARLTLPQMENPRQRARLVRFRVVCPQRTCDELCPSCQPHRSKPPLEVSIVGSGLQEDAAGTHRANRLRLGQSRCAALHPESNGT